jgi:hypothetical protein
MGWNPLRARREREFARLDAFRSARRLVDEDLRVFGEQLGELSAAIAAELGHAIRDDHQRASDLYESATRGLRDATTSEEVVAVETLLNDGRFHLACALARRDGVEIPTGREPCFFNPQHGPGVTDVTWAPPGNEERRVRACRSDADRLNAGEQPDVRMVRVGDRYVPWYVAGGSLEGVVRHDAQAYHGRTGQSDPYVSEARARADIGKMDQLKP